MNQNKFFSLTRLTLYRQVFAVSFAALAINTEVASAAPTVSLSTVAVNSGVTLEGTSLSPVTGEEGWWTDYFHPEYSSCAGALVVNRGRAASLTSCENCCTEFYAKNEPGADDSDCIANCVTEADKIFPKTSVSSGTWTPQPFGGTVIFEGELQSIKPTE